MESSKRSNPLLDVERQTEHALRPGFRIAELQISKVTQALPPNGDRFLTTDCTDDTGEIPARVAVMQSV